MKITLSGIVVCLCVLACSEPSNDTRADKHSAKDAKPMETATQTDFKLQMQSVSQDFFALRPEVATYYGVSDEVAGAGTLSRLGDYSPAGERARRAGVAAIVGKLEAMGKLALTNAETISLNAIKSEIEGALLPAQTVEYGQVLGEYGTWFLPYPVSHLSGLPIEFPALMEDKFAVTTTDEAMAYLARLERYPAALDGLIEKLQQDVGLNVMPPDFVIDKTIANLQLQIKEQPQDHALVSSFKEKLTSGTIDNSPELIQWVVQSVANGYYPATQRLIAALQAIRPKATHQAGIGHLPNGAKLYQAMITHLGNSTSSADDIHQLGLNEVSRISAEMDTLLKQVGYMEGTVGARMQVLLNDPKYLYPNTPAGKAQLMADIRADLDLVDAKLKDWFGRLPDQAVDIRAVPDIRAASTSGAFYDAPSQDGSRKGTFWISLHDTAALPSYSLQTLTYHETNPGHHLQTIIGLSDTLPLLSTIFYSNAAGEGWALYAERLAAEMGIYAQDPIDNIGRLQSELHRAVRLVLDTGMHAKGWSREQAIDYSVATEGIHLSEATNEVERYAVWPGQALGYKLGELKILELRAKAKQTLGDKFDIRVFHDRLLENGALPLNLMEEKINQWLKTMS